MFSTRHLIGTPQRGGGLNQTSNRIDFTPIGKSNKNKSKPSSHNIIELASPGNSTFDRTGDLFMDTTITTNFKQNAKPSTARSLNPTITRFGMDHNNILNNGMTSIKEQQMENHKLETENYNLKIKLATLTKFLDQTPEEQRDLLNHNIDLKQQLTEASTEIRSLKESLRELQYLTNKENGEYEMSKFKEQYDEMLDSKDDEIAKLERELQVIKADIINKSTHAENYSLDLQDQLDGLKQEVDELTNENETLRLKLEDFKDKEDDLKKVYEDTLSQLEKERNNHDSEYEIVSKELKKVSKEYQDLKYDYEVAILKIQDTRVEQDFKSKEIIETLRKDLKDSDHEISNLQDEIYRWKSKYETAQIESTRARGGSTKNMDELLSTQAQLRSLEDKMKTLEKNYSSVKRELEAKEQEINRATTSMNTRNEVNLSKLESKVEQLTRELKEKDREEYNLRSQIQALIKQSSQSEGSAENLKFYQTQFESLKARERNQREEINDLQTQINDLKLQIQNTRGDSDKFDHRLSKLQTENKELIDKLEFYESEYSLLEKAYKDAELEIKTIKSDLVRLDLTCKQLEEENRKLLEQYRSAAMTGDNFNSGKSALDELESFNRRKLEKEKQELIGEVNSMKHEINRMQSELEFAKSNQHIQQSSSIPYGVSDFYKSGNERVNFTSVVEEREIRIRELESRSKRLERLINEKDTTIETLEFKIQEMDRAKKLNILMEDDEKTDLMKQKSTNSTKIKILQLENENLQQEFKAEIDYYKNKLNALSAEKRETAYKPERESSVSPSIVSLLERQLEESQKLRNDLSKKLEESMMTRDDILFKSERFQRENSQLVEAVTVLEKKESMYRKENLNLEEKIKSLTQEVNRANHNCTRLADKLREVKYSENNLRKEDDMMVKKVQDLQSKNRLLSRDLDLLNSKMSSTHLSSSYETARKNLKDNELQYYKAKLYDMNLKANDLQIMNNFILSSIKNSNRLIKDDIIKLTRSGIYPDYAAMRMDKLSGNKKLTFKVLAKFVLALIRIKNRFEKAEKRKLQLFDLRTEIEKGKITLLD